MIPSKSKRPSNAKKQNAAHGKVLDFSQAKGKVLKSVQLNVFPTYRAISLSFRDKTSLDFVINTCFTVEADYFDWKTGRKIRRKGQQAIHVR